MFDLNTTHYDGGRCFVQTTDGGYAIVGNTEDYLYVGPHGAWYRNDSSLMVKTNADGIIQWQKEIPYLSDTSAIFQTPDSGYVLFPRGAFMVKLDSQGNVILNKTLGVSASGIVQTDDRGFIFVHASGNDALLAKVDDSGNLLWNKTLFSFPNSFSNSIQTSNIALASDGAYFIAGWSSTFCSAIGKGEPNLWLLKIDSAGNLLFSKGYSYDANAGIDQNPAAIDTAFVAGTYDGGCIIDGTVGYPFLVKIASNGDWQWNRSYPRGVTTRASFASIIQTSDGGYVAVGGYPGIGLSSTLIVGTDADGNLMWNQTIASSIDLAGASSIIKTNDGAAIILGSLNGNIWLAKISIATQQGPLISKNIIDIGIIATVIVRVSAVTAFALLYHRKHTSKNNST
jgi:hypothetical protein